MEDIDIPSFFLCPISLDIMKDPVTLSTGITYDRASIEKWLYTSKNNTCPVTKQLISEPNSETFITPNHTLRRLIQSWCILNALDRIPTPKPPVNKAQMSKLLSEAASAPPHLQLKCLQTVRSISLENESNKRCFESAGGVQFLTSIVVSSLAGRDPSDEVAECSKCGDEALTVLWNLQISEAGLRKLALAHNGEFLTSLIKILQSGSYDSRAYALFLLKSIYEVVDRVQLISLSHEIFIELVQILHDQVSPKTTRSALELLALVAPWGRNKVKSVEAGAVGVLIDILLNTSDKRIAEMVLILLDTLCGCAEGRSELVGNAAGLAIVSKKIMRVSHEASERAVRILHWVSRYSATPAVVQEMLQIGAVAKLCLVVQMESRGKTKEKATEILKMHGRQWRNAGCIPATLAAFYPS
uniref:U-box domain-containing protein n=1 Tax=Kalanchoe fedtschenkoi TaxID=63787 RepID=A0A7N0V5R9_KALFE